MELEDLMNQVFACCHTVHLLVVLFKGNPCYNTYDPCRQSTFRIPQRVTPNDAKRQAWFADLANLSVPLHKLGKSVPHGVKDQDLLDLLHANAVAILWAVWFLHVFGANEVTSLCHKPTYDPMQYSAEWANTCSCTPTDPPIHYSFITSIGS